MNHPRPRASRSLAAVALLWTCAAQAQSTLWETHNDAGTEARQAGRYAEAETQFKFALAEAEKFGPSDSRLATSLNNLAGLYNTQGKYDQVEPLYKRSLAIAEKALGPDHPNVATALENYALLLRTTKREVEAQKLEERAAVIRLGAVLKVQ